MADYLTLNEADHTLHHMSVTTGKHTHTHIPIFSADGVNAYYD